LMKIILDDFQLQIWNSWEWKIAIEKLETESYDIILMDLDAQWMDLKRQNTFVKRWIQLFQSLFDM
jgi:CheY-like chemotaxis protein